MNIRQRRKRIARSRKIGGFVLDFDDGTTLQVPIFDSRIAKEGCDTAIANAVKSALLFDAVRKGTTDIVDVEVTVKGRDIQIDWIGEV
jgi:3-dehydroquinate dehydratase